MVTACNRQNEILPTENKAQVTSQSKDQSKIQNTFQVTASPVKLHNTVKPVLQLQQAKPLLNLSVGNIIDESKTNNDALFIGGNTLAEENSALFKTLNKKNTDKKINLSGELLTDKNADDDTSYLKSVDGVQIDIEGSFK